MKAQCIQSGFRLRAAVFCFVVMAASLVTVSQARSADQQGGKAVAPITRGQRVFTCGHSFHVFVYRILDDMAKAASIQDHQSVGISRIGGSRVLQHWDVPDEKNEAKAALRAGKVDALTLSPIWLPDEGIEKFAKLGLEHNPGLRVTVQEFWLPNDTYHPVYPLETRVAVDHNATDITELKKQQALYDRDLSGHVREVNQRLGKPALFIVPVGQAANALREKIVAGQAPGLKTQWDLFRDPWGHPQAPLQVLDGYCHFAVIYRRSPVGLPVPKDLAAYRRMVSDPGLRKPGWRPSKEELAQAEALSEIQQKDLNRLLQELAWDAVTQHPLSGVRAGARTE